MNFTEKKSTSLKFLVKVKKIGSNLKKKYSCWAKESTDDSDF